MDLLLVNVREIFVGPQLKISCHFYNYLGCLVRTNCDYFPRHLKSLRPKRIAIRLFILYLVRGNYLLQSVPMLLGDQEHEMGSVLQEK